MRQLADDVFLLDGFPPNLFNVYLVGDVLIDAGTRYSARRILWQLGSRTVAAHALTHAHPDHQGSSHEVCERLGVPLWCGSGDADAMETGEVMRLVPYNPMSWISFRAFAGPGHPVARRLREGDDVAGFTVLETPGHSPGHVALWREADRSLFVGDVVWNLNPRTGLPGLHEPPKAFSPDPALNRESARRLAALEPRSIYFGHGPPSSDTASFMAFVASLSDG